jgi:RNA polymerase sigma factor (sigma-70 family)
MTDAEVIRRSKDDGRLFAIVYDRHHRDIHRFARARVGADLADDVASETFVVAFRQRERYDLSRPDARPWLFGIAVNLVHRHRRTEQRRLRAFARLAADGAAIGEPGELRLDPGLAAALLALSPSERNLVLLHAWAGLSYEQLANSLSLPLGTVRSRLHRISRKLRRAVVDDASPAKVPEGVAS